MMAAFFRQAFSEESLGDSLEAYILRNNPQTPEEVEFYERKFFEERRQQKTLYYTY